MAPYLLMHEVPGGLIRGTGAGWFPSFARGDMTWWLPTCPTATPRG